MVIKYVATKYPVIIVTVYRLSGTKCKRCDIVKLQKYFNNYLMPHDGKNV